MDIRDVTPGGRRRLNLRRLLQRTAAFVGLAVLAACTSTESQMETGAATLPHPQVVIVDTFATSANEVTLDQGLSTEVEEAIKADRGTSRTEQEVQASRQVADAIADKLVVEIRDMGLRAERGSALPASGPNHHDIVPDVHFRNGDVHFAVQEFCHQRKLTASAGK